MDTQTLKDLEIFDAEEGNQSLFAMLDTTLTTGGHMALRRRFHAPYHSREAILETQEIVRYFLAAIDDWKIAINEDDVRYVEKYMASNIVVFDVRGGLLDWFTAKEFQLNHSDYYHFLSSGIDTLYQFLAHLEAFLEDKKRDAMPRYLRNLLFKTNKVQLQLKDEIGQAKNRHSPLTVLRTDSLLRGRYKGEIEKLLEDFYEVDALFAMAKACRTHRLQFPELAGDRTLRITALRHLFVQDCVPNDFISGNRNFVFLTGPNMSGKTTFLKALCLSVFLAHLGMGVPAEAATIPVFDDLFTSINIEDSLRKKQSYFFSEITRVKEMATLLQQGKRLFVVMDEMFRGTNLKDAIDCSLLVVERLLDWHTCFFVLASHIAELGAMLPHEKVSFLYFESTVKNGNPVFSHRCTVGVSFEHLGTVLLLQAGIPTLLKTKDYGT